MRAIFLVLFIFIAFIASAKTSQTQSEQIIQAVTHGKLKGLKGQYFSKLCGEMIEYEAEVIDLNNDGQLEVFTLESGTCLGGRAGVLLNLYVKDASGQWRTQFDFPGFYKILKTKNKGYPDIEIGGPGLCFPVWRWDGQKYQLHKKCP